MPSPQSPRIAFLLGLFTPFSLLSAVQWRNRCFNMGFFAVILYFCRSHVKANPGQHCCFEIEKPNARLAGQACGQAKPRHKKF